MAWLNRLSGASTGFFKNRTARFVASVAVLFFAFTLLVYQFLTFQLRKDFVAEVHALHTSLGNVIAPSLTAGEFRNAWLSVHHASGPANIRSFLLLGPDGSLLVDDYEGVQLLEAEQYDVTRPTSRFLSSQSLYLADRPVQFSGVQPSGYRLILLIDTNPLALTLRRIGGVLTLVSLASASLIGYLAIRYNRRLDFAIQRMRSGVLSVLEGGALSEPGADALDRYFPDDRALAELGRDIEQAKVMLSRTARVEAENLIAQQVAHDIKSPLAAIQVILSGMKEASEDQRVLLRTALNRLRSLAASLEAKRDSLNTRAAPGERPSELILNLVEAVVAETRVRLGSLASSPELALQVEEDAALLYAHLESSDFMRSISNLLNNAVESIRHGQGRIGVRLSREAGRGVVVIEDNGSGIPDSVLAKLGQVGNTVGKTGGKGLGISQAKAAIEASGGTLSIQRRSNSRREDAGTRVKIELPVSSAPGWACTELAIGSAQTLVVLDDDPSIHAVWRARFQELGVTRLKCFNQSVDLISWLEESIDEDCFFLLDHDLRYEQLTGLDLMERLRLSQTSCLVTSRWDCAKIQNRLEKLGGKMFPKVLIPYLPIRIVSSEI